VVVSYEGIERLVFIGRTRPAPMQCDFTVFYMPFLGNAHACQQTCKDLRRQRAVSWGPVGEQLGSFRGLDGDRTMPQRTIVEKLRSFQANVEC
jgi:hypothetical protein